MNLGIAASLVIFADKALELVSELTFGDLGQGRD